MMDWYLWPTLVRLERQDDGHMLYCMKWQQYITMNCTCWRWVWLRAFIAISTFRFWPFGPSHRIAEAIYCRFR